MSTTLLTALQADELAPALAKSQAQQLAPELEALSGMPVYARSIVARQQSLLFLGRRGHDKYLGILAAANGRAGFVGQTNPVTLDGSELTLTLCPTTPANAAALRAL